MKIKLPKINIPKIHRLKIRLPKLVFLYRLILYLITITFAALSLVNVATECFNFVVGIVFYVCAAISLTASSYYLITNINSSVRKSIIPKIHANPFTDRISQDYRYRTITFAIPGMIMSIVFAGFNGVIALLSMSPWFGTLAAYYILLSFMRVAVLKRIKQEENDRKQNLLEELAIYKKCGITFVFLTIVLMGMIVLLILSEEGKSYPGLTIYAVAAYSFYKITMSIINVVKTRKMKSLPLMAIRDIGLVDASVSILTLQTAMFEAFGNGEESYIKLLNGFTGSLVCSVVLSTAIYELVTAHKIKKKKC